MRNWVNLKSEFVKYALVLMSGTFISQVLSYLFSPVITRLYTPEEAAELGLFIRIVGIGAAIATLRYELAIPITKTDSHAFRLYNFALRVVLTVTLIAGISVLVPMYFSGDISSVIFYALIPLSILFLSVFNIGTNWSIRLKLYRIISYAKVTNSLVSGGLKVILGWMGTGYIGLIWGTFIGMFTSALWFIVGYFKGKRDHSITLKSPRNYILAKNYREFPIINLPHTLMDLTRDLIIAFLILELFTKEDFGLYDHSYRMLRLPLVFVGSAIGQVFFQRCAEKFNNKETILPMIAKSIWLLAMLSVIPFGIVFFFGEELFGFVFGANWSESGVFSEILVPMFMVNFISSPISTLPTILRRQKTFFLLSIVGTIAMISALALPHIIMNADIYTCLWVLSITQAIYLLYLIYRIFGFARTAESNQN